MVSSTQIFQICFLVSLIQIYMLLCAVTFQGLENGEVLSHRENITEIVEKVKLGKLKKSTAAVVWELRKAFKDEEDDRIKERFNRIENAYLFTMSSFATLGNSGLRPSKWKAKLFYVFVTPAGVALYVIIIVSMAYCLRDLTVYCITKIESKKDYLINFFNTKILLTSTALCILITQCGGVVSMAMNQGYLEGVYLSIDTMSFVGNLKFTETTMKLYFTFLLSLYLILVHGLVLVFICNLQQACGEVFAFLTNGKSRQYCLDEEMESFHEDYKEKLMASFESPASSTPSSENEKGDIAFPQFWGVAYDFEPEMLNEKLSRVQADRRDSRFSEIFNAQKELFEPIIESTENIDEDMSDTSSYKSTKEFFQNDVENDRKEKNILDLRDITGHESDSDEDLSSGECTPTGSLPSSFSNISLNECEQN